MNGVIKLLPDLVANQIAAGEVIQRPASAVKELLENAIDAKSTHVELWVADAGKKLIMVVDNGKGMSPADCRLCFDRHATSKIKCSDDLFKINTFGFRGEALASIASIAQVELKSKREEDELATVIRIEGGKFISQEPDAHPNGTTVSVKNIFYNTPARRNFLKNNNIELKHIIEEFSRVVIANENINFRMFNEGKELYHLPASNRKQRIVNLLGNHYNSRLVNMSQDSDTDIVKISGFIGKPEFAKKSRGEQYFFVNGRFIRHSYLNHAVIKAYQELIQEGYFPSWFIFFDIDPSQIDINIHPTKTEVNFIENQAIYAILHTATRSALGKHNLTPTLDFDAEPAFTHSGAPSAGFRIPTISSNPNYNPFDSKPKEHPNPAANQSSWKQSSLLHQHGWEKLYEISDTTKNQNKDSSDFDNSHSQETKVVNQKFLQIHNTWILTTIKSGVLIVHQQFAHQRIIFDEYIKKIGQQENCGQHLLFPIHIELSNDKKVMLDEAAERLKEIGFAWNEEKGKIYVTTAPAGIENDEVQDLFLSALECEKGETDESYGISFATRIAIQKGVQIGIPLSETEMESLVSRLFISSMPNYSPSGEKTYVVIPAEELFMRFSNNDEQPEN